MSMWSSLKGTVKRRIGTAGTETFNSGARILQIKALAGSGAGSIQIFADPTPLPLPASSGWFELQENHASLTCPTSPTGTIVFTGTTSYLVEYVDLAGLS